MQDEVEFIQLTQNELSEQIGEKIMTLSPTVYAKGEQKGRGEEIVKRLLKKGFDLDTIPQITDLPIEKN